MNSVLGAEACVSKVTVGKPKVLASDYSMTNIVKDTSAEDPALPYETYTPTIGIRGDNNMDEDAFRKFLIGSGRSQNAIKNAIVYVKEFQHYLQECKGIKELDEAAPIDLEDFVLWVEKEPRTSAKLHLWGIRYYYGFTSNEEMQNMAGELRQQRIKRTPFVLRNFRNVDSTYIEKLAAIGIDNIEKMLEAGRTSSRRKDISLKTGIPLESILELVKLSDLARIGGVKGIRARLYYDAGVDTLEKMANWDPKELREMLIEFVERTGFSGIAPLPKEAKGAVTSAKELLKNNRILTEPWS